jgi:hypothetical protein
MVVVVNIAHGFVMLFLSMGFVDAFAVTVLG